MPKFISVLPQSQGFLDSPLSVLLAPSGQEVGEDVVGVSMPGAPQEGRLDNLLEPLRKSPEEFQLLHDMQWTIQPVIVPLKDSKVILITGSVSHSESRSRREQDRGYKGGGEGGRDWGRDGGQEG